MKNRMILTLCVLCTLLGQGAGARAADGVHIEDDLFLGVWSPYVRRWQTEVPVCLWSETGDVFRVTATGLSSGRNFLVLNDLGQGVRYTVTLHSGRRFNRRERLFQNRPSRRAYPSSLTPYCSRGSSVHVRVTLNKPDIDRALPAIYSDTLLLVVSPL